MRPTTAQAVFGRVFERGDAPALVAWATILLENGSDSRMVLALASLSAPYTLSEVFALRDKVLGELGVLQVGKTEACVRYAREVAAATVESGDQDLGPLIEFLGQLYTETNSPDELLDFYLMKCAAADSREGREQHYVDGVTRDNLDARMRDVLHRFLAEDGGDTG